MNAIKRYLQVQSRPWRYARLLFLSTKREARPSLVLPRSAWPSKRTREKHSLSAIQSTRSWLRALIGEPWLSTKMIQFSYPFDLASCTRIIGMGIAMECSTYASIRHNTYGWRFHTQLSPHGTRGVWTTSRWCEVYQTLPPSREGAGTRTMWGGLLIEYHTIRATVALGWVLVGWQSKKTHSRWSIAVGTCIKVDRTPLYNNIIILCSS